MPEGHALHRLARRHDEQFGGHPVRVSSPQGRFAAAAAELDGAVLERAEAHGKHLFHVYAAGTVHVHLGLYGAFTEFPLPAEEPRGQVRMRLVGPGGGTDLRGPIACELDSDVTPNVLRIKDSDTVLATFEQDGFTTEFRLDSRLLTYKYKFKSL